MMMMEIFACYYPLKYIFPIVFPMGFTDIHSAHPFRNKLLWFQRQVTYLLAPVPVTKMDRSDVDKRKDADVDPVVIPIMMMMESFTCYYPLKYIWNKYLN